MTLRLAVLRPYRGADRERLWRTLSPWFTLVEPAAFDPDSLAGAVAGADAAIAAALPAPVLAAADRLALLQTPGTGVEGLDLAALARRGIAVCNSHSGAGEVAEHAVALLLALARRIPLHDRLLRQGEWFRGGDGTDRTRMSLPLSGATVGLLGLGHVGRALQARLAGFGVTFLACRHRSPAPEGIETVELNELLARADAVMVSLPLTEATRGLIDAAALARMKPEALLVCVGRAEVIDRAALLAALDHGHLGGAALDVWWQPDGIEAVNGFTGLDTVVLSPHRAGTRADGNPALDDVIANLIAFARDGVMRNRVDPVAGY